MGMRRTITALLLPLLAVVLAGCSRDQPSATDDVDLVQTLRILPTPPGLDLSEDARAGDLATVRSTFTGGMDIPKNATEQYADLGLRESAIRTWRGPDGARLVVLATRWPNHMTASNTGAGAADVLPLRSGASAWTPTEIRGARGSRHETPRGRTASLSLAVESVNLFVRSEGPVADADVVRTLQRAATPLIARTEQ